MEAKPKSVEVGQLWRGSCSGLVFTVIGQDADGWLLDYNDGTEPLHGTDPTGNGDNEFLGYAPGVAPPSSPTGERDWSRWLPPGPMPGKAGRQKFAVGQVGASAFGGVRAVWKVESVAGEYLGIEMLSRTGAEYETSGFADSSLYAQHAILVADVGCEPTPPEVLYARPAVPPGPAKPENIPQGPVLPGTLKTSVVLAAIKSATGEEP